MNKLIVDYYFIRKQNLVVRDLYSKNGIYRFSGGVNICAMIALLSGILFNVPGFLVLVKAVRPGLFWPWLTNLFDYSWFVGFIVSGIVYLILMPKDKFVSNTLSIKEAAYVSTD